MTQQKINNKIYEERYKRHTPPKEIKKFIKTELAPLDIRRSEMDIAQAIKETK
jgi:hypothetical protein